MEQVLIHLVGAPEGSVPRGQRTDNISLGWHRDCHGAVLEARIYFPHVDGCAICSMMCHGR